MMARSSARLLVGALITAALAGCAGVASPPAGETGGTPAPAAPALTAAATSPPSTPQVAYTGSFGLSPESGAWGTKVTAVGKNLPPNTPFRLVWNTVKGSWVLKGKYNDEFHGRQFDEVAVPLATVTTDASGGFQTEFTVPEGWGADHDVTVVELSSGKVRNKANFHVELTMSISPTSGPPGTPITVEARGIGHRYLYNSWVLMYDNKLTGWISSVTTNGKATMVIPAAGQPGKHVIKVMHGWSSQAYLNPHQSAEPERPQFVFAFTVTDEPAVMPLPASQQGVKPLPGVAPPGEAAAIWTHPSTGPLGTPVQILGRGLPAGQEVDLVWYRMEGSRLEGWTIQERAYPLGKALVGADGKLVFSFEAPDDLGGFHRIEALVGGQPLAEGGFTITPMVFALEQDRGPVGTTIRIHLKGVGWTETANIYHLVYDNAYIGYACGFKSLGDVEIFLPATGEPGWHFIDLYPGIYKGKDITGVINFRVPQLTAEEDHPGERLPVFRLAFLVTE